MQKAQLWQYQYPDGLHVIDFQNKEICMCTDSNKPMIFKGMKYCSDQCRRRIEKDWGVKSGYGYSK